MAFRIAELYTQFSQRGLPRLNREVDGLRGRLDRSHTTLTRLSTRATQVFAVAIPAAIIASIREAAKFETQLAEVSTMLSGQGVAWMPVYRQEIAALARTYGEATATLSKGMYNILSASVAPRHAMEVLRIATESAKGGFTDAATAVDGLTSLLNAYQLSASEAGRVSDLMFATVKRGKLTFGELAGIIGRVAPVAKAAGMSMETMLAALATMTRQGIRAHHAAIRLVAILKGVDGAGRDLAGTMKDFVGASLDEIKRKVTDVRGATGIAALSQDFEGLKRDIAAMADAGGSRMEAFRKQQQTTTASMDKAKEAVKALGRSFGEELAPGVQAAAGWLARAYDRYREWASQYHVRWTPAGGVWERRLGGGKIDEAALERQRLEFLEYAKAMRESERDLFAEAWHAEQRARGRRPAIPDTGIDAHQWARGLAYSQHILDEHNRALEEQARHMIEARDAAERYQRSLRDLGREVEGLALQGRIDLLEAMGLGQEAELARVDAWLERTLQHIEDAWRRARELGDVRKQIELEQLGGLASDVAAQRYQRIIMGEEEVERKLRVRMEWVSGEQLVRQIQAAIGGDRDQRVQDDQLKEQREIAKNTREANRILKRVGQRPITR